MISEYPSRYDECGDLFEDTGDRHGDYASASDDTEGHFSMDESLGENGITH
jgi:hypothetical protein